MIEWMHRHLARRDASCCRSIPHNDRGTGTAAGRVRDDGGRRSARGLPVRQRRAHRQPRPVERRAQPLQRRASTPGWTSPTSTRSAAPSSTATSCPCIRAIPTWATWSTPRSPARTRTRSRRPSPPARTATPGRCPTCRSTRRTWAAATRRSSASTASRARAASPTCCEAEYGLELPRRLQIEFSQVVQGVMDASGKELTAQDLFDLFEREYGLNHDPAPRHQMSRSSGHGRRRSIVHLPAQVLLDGRALGDRRHGQRPDRRVSSMVSARAMRREHPRARLPRALDRRRRECAGRRLPRTARRGTDAVRRRASIRTSSPPRSRRSFRGYGELALAPANSRYRRRSRADPNQFSCCDVAYRPRGHVTASGLERGPLLHRRPRPRG